MAPGTQKKRVFLMQNVRVVNVIGGDAARLEELSRALSRALRQETPRSSHVKSDVSLVRVTGK